MFVVLWEMYKKRIYLIIKCLHLKGNRRRLRRLYFIIYHCEILGNWTQTWQYCLYKHSQRVRCSQVHQMNQKTNQITCCTLLVKNVMLEPQKRSQIREGHRGQTIKQTKTVYSTEKKIQGDSLGKEKTWRAQLIIIWHADGT